MTESLGINPFRVRLITFVIAALLSALSGWLYAHMSRFVSPAPFDVSVGILYLLMAMVGGMAYLSGAIVGAAVVTLLKNSIQDWLPVISPGASGQLEVIVFSVLFILLLQRARAGIVPFALRWLPRVQPAPPHRRRIARASPAARARPADPERRRRDAPLRRPGRRQQCELRGQGRRNPRSDRTQRRRQDHDVQPDHRRAAAEPGQDQLSRAGHHRRAQRQIARAGIARTFQHVKLRKTMTLLDNVLLGTYGRTHSGFFAGVLRLDRAEEARAQAEAMRQLQRVGLADRAFELAGNLPLGNQRLLEIARALAADPALLMLDEPAAGLRSAEKAELAHLLEALRAEGLSILLVEHDMDFVMGLVDRMVVMDFGAKLCEGTPAVVRSDPRVQEAYLGGVA